MNIEWDKYVDAHNSLVANLIKAGIDVKELINVEALYKNYIDSCSNK